MSNAVDNFVEHLLERTPQPPNSITLDIDTDGDIPALFEVLLLVMTGILKKWYRPPITIGNIGPEDAVRLIDYFASFGIAFKLTVEDDPRVYRINNREYIQQSRLEAMKFQVSHSGKLYTVTFSSLATT